MGVAARGWCLALVFSLLAFGFSPLLHAESFADWIDGHGLTGTNAAALADPDGDGVPNLVEYAFAGFDPSAADARATTEFVAGTRATNTVSPQEDITVIVLTPDLKPPKDGAPFYIGLRYKPRAGTEGLVLEPQYSWSAANLGSWLDGRGAFYAPTQPDTNGAVISWMRGMFEKEFKAAFLRLKISTK